MMRNSRFSLKVLAGFALALVFSCAAGAQATRTWVSGVGDDANPCSRTAPCKTFAGAISTTAGGGEIDCLDPGGFGAVTITKSITIDCGSGVGSVLVSGTNGIIVAAGSTDVIYIRNLSLNGILGNGSGLAGINGIRYLSGKVLFLDHVSIIGFSTNCVDANGGTTGELVIENSNFSNCTAAGVNATTTAGTMKVDLHGVHISNVGTGITANNGARVNVRDSVLSQITTGVTQPGSPALGSIVMIQGSTISFASTALQSAPGAFIGASGNNFFGDALIYSVNGGSISTGNDNSNFGNGTVGATSGAVPKV